ncbi:hypothetical protein [Paraburkholderia susongensis]|nr:hypothetical protein [Paraburkholderia susongensis]
MFFNETYYVDHHMPLAERLLQGHVNFVRMAAEFDVTLLRDPNVVRSPCVYHLYVATLADVEAFRRFLGGPMVQPLRDDMLVYTNCECEWSVSRFTHD